MDHHHQQKALSDNNTTNDSRCSSSSIHQMPVRFLALASIREPIQRTLSMIHQVCNKNFNGLPSEEKAICKRCSYSGDDKVYWDDHCLKTNQAYANLTYRIPSADLLIIDSMFLDKFFAMVEAALEQKIPMKDVRDSLCTHEEFHRAKKHATSKGAPVASMTTIGSWFSSVSVGNADIVLFFFIVVSNAITINGHLIGKHSPI
eukprot:scaffold624_cov176-Amphora_coffeaeformis.AAC.1